QGIPVPNNWKTGDKGTFTAIVRQQHRKKLRDVFHASLNGMPEGLGLAGFAASQKVQERWKASLGYPPTRVALPIGKLSKDDFRRRIYEPVLGDRVKYQLAAY